MESLITQEIRKVFNPLMVRHARECIQEGGWIKRLPYEYTIKGKAVWLYFRMTTILSEEHRKWLPERIQRDTIFFLSESDRVKYFFYKKYWSWFDIEQYKKYNTEEYDNIVKDCKRRVLKTVIHEIWHRIWFRQLSEYERDQYIKIYEESMSLFEKIWVYTWLIWYREYWMTKVEEDFATMFAWMYMNNIEWGEMLERKERFIYDIVKD